MSTPQKSFVLLNNKITRDKRTAIYKWLWSYFRGFKMRYFVGLFFVAVVAATGMVQPVVTGKIVNVVFENKQIDQLAHFLVILGVVMLIRAVLRVVNTFLVNGATINIVKRIRMDSYQKLTHADFLFFDQLRAGGLINRASGDIDQVRKFMCNTVKMLVENIVPLVVTPVVLFHYDKLLSTTLFVGVLPLLFISDKMIKTIRPLHIQMRNFSTRLSDYTQENIKANRVVKSFVREDYEVNRFYKLSRDLTECSQTIAKVNSTYSIIIEGLSYLVTVSVVLVGGLLVLNQSMSISTLVVFYSSIWWIRRPFINLPGIFNGWQSFLVCAERIMHVTEYRPKISSPPTPKKPQSYSGAITFKDVNFCYENQTENALSNINLQIKPGQFVGIIGSAGSGKSTLMKLLTRFYDISIGEILLDGINIKEYQLDNLRHHVAFAMQDVFLFSETALNNIRYYNETVPDDTVTDFAKITEAHQFIMETPDHYNTILGERGVGLSGGQRQRLALSRILLKNSSVIILDSVTGALDVETEQRVMQNLEEFRKTKTTIMITHRVSALANADQIFVLERGHIIQQGTHDELMQQEGYYRRAVIRQEEQDNNRPPSSLFD